MNIHCWVFNTTTGAQVLSLKYYIVRYKTFSMKRTSSIPGHRNSTMHYFTTNCGILSPMHRTVFSTVAIKQWSDYVQVREQFKTVDWIILRTTSTQHKHRCNSGWIKKHNTRNALSKLSKTIHILQTFQVQNMLPITKCGYCIPLQTNDTKKAHILYILQITELLKASLPKWTV